MKITVNLTRKQYDEIRMACNNINVTGYKKHPTTQEFLRSFGLLQAKKIAPNFRMKKVDKI